MKKVSKLLVLVMLSFLLVLTACSQSAQEARQEGTKSESAGESASGDSSDVVEIQFWYGLGSVAGETMESIIADFNASQDKVRVTGVQQGDYAETFQKVQAAIAAGQPPAVFIGSNVQRHAPAGILEDLTPYMDERTPIEDYLEVFMADNTYDGKVYAMPAYGTTQVMYYRKDLMAEAGIDPKVAYASWENLAEASKEIQSKGLAWGHLPMWGFENLRDLAFSNGGQMLSDDGKTVMINSPEWVEAWDFVRKMIFEDKTAKIESGGQGWEYWYRTIDNVMNGEAMGYTGSSGDKGDLDFSIIDSAPQPGLNGNPGKPIAGGHSLLVPAAASEEQKKAAFDWIAYFTSPEVSAKWSMKIGYIPIRKSALEVEEYKKFIEENPYANVPYEQALTATPNFTDPTNGKIHDALSIAADKVELQNIPAQEALDEAARVAQEALDEVNNK